MNVLQTIDLKKYYGSVIVRGEELAKKNDEELVSYGLRTEKLQEVAWYDMAF